MKKAKRASQKAYRNEKFLNSPDARGIRILSEFIEPLSRFRRAKVGSTIVFFGSARIQEPQVARKKLRAVEARLSKHRNLSRIEKETLQESRNVLEMSKYYSDAVELSRLLTKWSTAYYPVEKFLVCSGGGPGIMEAANRGAHAAGGESVGLNIGLPFEQSSNPFIPPELNFEFHYFFMRKFWFAYLGKAFVMFPGGFGTFDELMEILTLLQTGKIKKKVTVVLYGSDYWKEVLNFDLMKRLQLISRADLKLFSYADTPAEAFELLTAHLRRHYPADRKRR